MRASDIAYFITACLIGLKRWQKNRANELTGGMLFELPPERHKANSSVQKAKGATTLIL